MDALRKIQITFWFKIIFYSPDSDGAPSKSREPYCTICSKMALDVGIAEFVLWQDKGVCVYNTEGITHFLLIITQTKR
jgi:hypothetical protein